MASVEIRPIKEEELLDAVALRSTVPVPSGKRTIHSFFKHNPELFFAAVDDAGKVCGVCAAVIFDGKDAYFSFFTVAREKRGQGIGRLLWQRTVKSLEGYNVFLLATLSTGIMYVEKYGFQKSNDITFLYTNAYKPDVSQLVTRVPGVIVTKYSGDRLQALVNYEKQILGMDRTWFFQLSADEPEACVKVALNEAGGICGYGLLQGGLDEGDLTGVAVLRTVIADTPDVAELLAYELISNFPDAMNKGVYLKASRHSRPMIDKLKGEIFDQGSLYYDKYNPIRDFQKVFVLALT